MAEKFTRAIKYAVKALDLWLPLKIQYDQIPGLSVGIVRKGKLVYQKGFGYADVKLKIPITPETCFRIASISKTFTAIVVMQLAEQGKINLDDRAEKYLPWFRIKGKNSSKITIRQLLSHTAGVFRDGNTPHWENDRFPDFAGLKKSISGKTIVFKNLTRFKYSNFGFALLGEIIKKVSGMSYIEYANRNIIKKLGMERTAADFTKETETWLAKGYSRPIPNKDRETFRHSETKAYAPATGFLSNVLDLAKYLAALSFKRKDINALISIKSKKEIMKKHWDTGGEGESYGLGFKIYEIGKRKITGHSGGFAGFTTQISLDIKNDIGVITLSNVSDSSAPSINKGILEMIYGFTDNKNRYGEGRKLQNQEKYEGIYRSRWGDAIVVGIDKALIAFDAKTDSPLKYETLFKPGGKDKFSMETKSNFDYPGEFATFVFKRKKKKAKGLIWGATPFVGGCFTKENWDFRFKIGKIRGCG